MDQNKTKKTKAAYPFNFSITFKFWDFHQKEASISLYAVEILMRWHGRYFLASLAAQLDKNNHQLPSHLLRVSTEDGDRLCIDFLPGPLRVCMIARYLYNLYIFIHTPIYISSLNQIFHFSFCFVLRRSMAWWNHRSQDGRNNTSWILRGFILSRSGSNCCLYGSLWCAFEVCCDEPFPEKICQLHCLRYLLQVHCDFAALAITPPKSDKLDTKREPHDTSWYAIIYTMIINDQCTILILCIIYTVYLFEINSPGFNHFFVCQCHQDSDDAWQLATKDVPSTLLPEAPI